MSEGFVLLGAWAQLGLLVWAFLHFVLQSRER
jgi:hypothetical protein